MKTAVVPEPRPRAARTAAAPAAASLWRTYQGADTGATDERSLIERHLPLVRSVVDRIRVNLPSHIEADDLYSVGITGLIAAVSNYDPAQQQTFAGYASRRIRGAVLDELRRLDWRPRRARAKARKIKETVLELEQRHGRPATDEEIRSALGLTAKEFAKWLEDAKPATFLALDQSPDEESGERASLHEIIPDETDVTGRDNLERDEIRELVAQRIRQLPDIPRKILAMYYHENMRLAEIAAVFNLTESRICQIHAQTILTLRAYVQRVRES
jgi:RNA polymerase sigma factor for flagellar operon FliA